MLIPVEVFQHQARWMDRHPIAVSAASGSVSGSLLWLLNHLVFTQAPPPTVDWGQGGLLEGSCPEAYPAIPLNFWTGVVVGFFIWPIIELAVLAKQWLTLSLRARIARFSWGSNWYKVV